MADETLTPGSVRRVTILRQFLKEGIYPKAVGPLLQLIEEEHVACCLCEPLCLDETCTCEEDAHLDPDCYRLRDALRTVLKRHYGDLEKKDG